ncbi:low molecular weight protein arginine phosphatase [Jeotgalibacillus proteolyticus]|uniref:Low molecular weight protein arginine phosphatase n=1 Tax=Jeotgalibacillus proteolyticus TaxID=2082395 RepID=A0A2S5G9F5_9BACL|nr:low molecular weight protein arginine phosphatase [Jeotgalibacillus proteolyticus]PPA69609.1 low molecular weight protein arginine phosphatase [Jeotgalibacillus proteolyticus]
MKILFVCTGNTCRSPMAEAILRHKGKDSLEVRSAGLFAMEGGQASQFTQEVLNENGIKHDHRSHSVTQADVHWADYIFAMTSAHKAMLMEQFPFAMDRIFTVKEFANARGLDVSDPFGGSVEVYKHTYNELNQLIDALIENIEKQIQGS